MYTETNISIHVSAYELSVCMNVYVWVGKNVKRVSKWDTERKWEKNRYIDRYREQRKREIRRKET